MEQDPTWVFNILWTDEAHFSLHGDVNNHNCRIWATSNPSEYTQKLLHSPKVTAWCGFTGSFIIGPFFFETQCPVNGWILETVPWPPQSPDLTPEDFWLWGYLKSRVYLSGPSSLSELKDAIRREVSSIHPDMLHSTVAGFVTRLECLLPCGGGHVEHILAYRSLKVGITFQDGDQFNSCQVIYSQFGLAIHQNDHQARRRFVEWAQNEIAVDPDFHKRILFSDEAHFWLNGYVNKQNCRIWSEANPPVYVKTPLHPEKLTFWCALWAGGILLQKR
ncbi:uncharacterized protein TNCV_4398221 [Trichonephila clavipes]|nr:uncharacterized protein TNCV_4398221 [Trichonephila clavipes]